MIKSIIHQSMWYLIVTVIFIIFVLSRTRFEIRKEIIINANSDKVWRAVIDFENYQKWNSQLFYLGGKIAYGEVIHLKLAVEGATPYEFKPIISTWVEGESFSWIGKTGIPRLFDGEHFFELRPHLDGTTTLINREEYRGVISLIMKQIPAMKLAPAGFEKMNIELKSYIENTM